MLFPPACALAFRARVRVGISRRWSPAATFSGGIVIIPSSDRTFKLLAT
ncbi:MAG TPA: hypothetical protein VHE35_14835 [Kofleriaceae bacterium]|nr:hypothetical protein [Kofleriaceae bacterium]